MLHQIPGIAIQGFDRDRRVIFWNEYSEALYGYTAAEALGEKAEDLFFPENLREAIIRQFGHWIRHGVPTLPTEQVLQSKDGRTLHVHAHHVLLYDTCQEPELYCIHIDQTQKKQTEEALKISDRFFRHAIDMFCILGSDGYFKKINPFWTTVLGWSEEELLGKPFIEYLHPEDLEPTLSIRKRLIEENTIVPFENRYLCKDGTYRWLSWKYFLNPEGQAIFGVARDVTLNKEVQKSLKESKERFRGIFENNHAVMLIIDPENGNLIDANPAARKYYGYSAEEFSKMNISQINLMSREAVRQEMRSAKKNKKTFFNFQHRLAQGEIRDVEVYSGPVRKILMKKSTNFFSTVAD